MLMKLVSACSKRLQLEGITLRNGAASILYHPVRDALHQLEMCRYTEAVAGGPERLASGSDDFTMFLWEPSKGSKPLQRMTGHVQLINQVGTNHLQMVAGAER